MVAALSMVISALGFVLAPIRWCWNLVTGRAAERQRLQREAKLAAFHELYKIAYRDLVADPPFPPLDTFADAETDTLIGYLRVAKKIIHGKEEYADQELLDHIASWDEIIYLPNRDELETESRWLYNHVMTQFKKLRRDLHLS